MYGTTAGIEGAKEGPDELLPDPRTITCVALGRAAGITFGLGREGLRAGDGKARLPSESERPSIAKIP